ncbi:MAG: AI-2E family transporter [Pseudomonadota bacterium]
MPVNIQSPLVRRTGAIAFLALIFGLALWVLSPFWAALAWAGVLAYVTWPLYVRLSAHWRGRKTLAAFGMTLAVALVLLVPVVLVMYTLAVDALAAAAKLREIAANGLPPMPPGILDLPGGEWLAAQYRRIQADPAWIRGRVEALGLANPDLYKAMAGSVGRSIAKFGLAIFALFFLYRHGESVLAQFRRIATHWIGGQARSYLSAVGVTVHAVVFGIVLTAVAQGTLAGLGYWVAGVPAPVMWGAITALVSLIPFAGPLVWGSLSIGLFINGDTPAAVGLFLWGALVVSWVDNFIRPIVISGPTRIPFLLVFLGVLGGLNAFGLIGLFLGPVILAVALAIWREWLESARKESGQQ